MNKPTGSLTDKAFSILEGAAVLVFTATRLAAKIRRRSTTVMLTKAETNLVIKQLREAATMIDNFMVIIEAGELVKLDKIGNAIGAFPSSRRAHTFSKGGRTRPPKRSRRRTR
jgi:hypothetical protein